MGGEIGCRLLELSLGGVAGCRLSVVGGVVGLCGWVTFFTKFHHPQKFVSCRRLSACRWVYRGLSSSVGLVARGWGNCLSSVGIVAGGVDGCRLSVVGVVRLHEWEHFRGWGTLSHKVSHPRKFSHPRISRVISTKMFP